MKPTLNNPTDEELNAAFAEKVAGWTNFDRDAPWGWRSPEGELWHRADVPRFTHSADAVLPWLEKFYLETDWIGGPLRHYTESTGPACWRVRLPGKFDGEVEDKSLPRAAVIALLRAHGVGVLT